MLGVVLASREEAVNDFYIYKRTMDLSIFRFIKVIERAASALLSPAAILTWISVPTESPKRRPRPLEPPRQYLCRL